MHLLGDPMPLSSSSSFVPFSEHHVSIRFVFEQARLLCHVCTREYTLKSTRTRTFIARLHHNQLFSLVEIGNCNLRRHGPQQCSTLIQGPLSHALTVCIPSFMPQFLIYR